MNVAVAINDLRRVNVRARLSLLVHEELDLPARIRGEPREHLRIRDPAGQRRTLRIGLRDGGRAHFSEQQPGDGLPELIERRHGPAIHAHGCGRHDHGAARLQRVEDLHTCGERGVNNDLPVRDVGLHGLDSARQLRSVDSEDECVDFRTIREGVDAHERVPSRSQPGR